MKLTLFFSALLCLHSFAAPVEEMTIQAGALVAALSDEQKAKAAFAFDADERENWHFVPKDRKGLPLKEMTPAQRHLAYALLSTGLSQRGYAKAVTIMSLEQILQDMEGPNRKFPRDPELYYVSIFGTPDAKGTWGWRVEGHHLSVNFTLVDGVVVAGTPSFMGTNPGEVRTGARAGLRVLGTEEELGRQLVKSLSDEQRAVAIFSAKAPDDVLTLATRKADLGKPTGLPLAKMDPAQRELAEKLIREYVGRLRGELAEADLAALAKAGLGEVCFAWAGGLERGQPHYYRLQGPTFVLEYDNTQNEANHVHAVWRDFQGDFGRDVLAEHIQQEHGKK